MTIADKLLQIDQVKQDIKTAIEMKGIPMTNVAFTEYANKILEISGGGGVVDEYFYYSKSYYTITNNSTLFPSAWQDMKDSETVLFDIPLALAAPNQEMGQGIIADLYVGTDGQLQALYDACANGTIPPPIVGADVYYVNSVATRYMGDISGDVGFPIPLYMFGFFGADDSVSFIIGDLTPLGMGLGLILAKFATVPIPNNNIVIQQGFEFENESGIIIPDSVTSIGYRAFYAWQSNNQPLIIPNSITSIGNAAFEVWQSNNQPLIIPNSITSIGYRAFSGWQSNNQPLIIPNSITSIGDSAFSGWWSNNQPLVIPNSVTDIGQYAFREWTSAKEFIMESETPPTITIISFSNTNNAPIYVPDGSVEAYKTATNWVSLADRIFSINDK